MVKIDVVWTVACSIKLNTIRMLLSVPPLGAQPTTCATFCLRYRTLAISTRSQHQGDLVWRHPTHSVAVENVDLAQKLERNKPSESWERGELCVAVFQNCTCNCILTNVLDCFYRGIHLGVERHHWGYSNVLRKILASFLESHLEWALQTDMLVWRMTFTWLHTI